MRNFNKNIFKSLDNEDKAYWFGFLAADGCLMASRYITTLELGETDLGHLEKFRAFLDAQHPLYRIVSKANSYVKESIKYRIALSNKDFYNDLLVLGLKPNKSLDLVFPGSVPVQFELDFIRGYFDGNGSCFNRNISYASNSKKYTYKRPGVTISGAEGMIHKIQSIIHMGRIYKRSLQSGKSISILQIRKLEEIKSLFHLFYKKDSCTRLDRKYEKFSEILNY